MSTRLIVFDGAGNKLQEMFAEGNLIKLVQRYQLSLLSDANTRCATLDDYNAIDWRDRQPGDSVTRVYLGRVNPEQVGSSNGRIVLYVENDGRGVWDQKGGEVCGAEVAA